MQWLRSRVNDEHSALEAQPESVQNQHRHGCRLPGRIDTSQPILLGRAMTLSKECGHQGTRAPFANDVLGSIDVGAAPMIRYAKTSDDLHIAYQVVGDGPELVYMPHWATHLELLWEEPSSARVLRRLASFARLILFDKRGVGLSDPVPVPVLPTLETWCDDVLAVLEASGTDAAALVASDAGSFVAQLFAALHPSRTSALVLYGA